MIDKIASDQDLFGARNKIDLIMQRGAGNFDINWSDGIPSELEKLYICDSHLKELLTDYDLPKYSHIKRDMLTGSKRISIRCVASTFLFGFHNSDIENRVHQRLTSDICKKVSKRHNILFHPGYYVCDIHMHMFSSINESELRESLGRSLLSRGVTQKVDTTRDVIFKCSKNDNTLKEIVLKLFYHLKFKETPDSDIFTDAEVSSYSYNRKVYILKRIIESIANVMIKDDNKLIIDTCITILKEKKHNIKDEKTLAYIAKYISTL